MVEAVTGAAIAGIVVLSYCILLQCMTAIIVLLSEFILVRVRALRALVAEPPRTVPVPVPAGDQDQGDGEQPRVRIGGPIRRWD